MAPRGSNEKHQKLISMNSQGNHQQATIMERGFWGLEQGR
jgi:hypothetical protein